MRSSFRPIIRIFVTLVLLLEGFQVWRVRERIPLGDPDFTIYYTAASIVRKGLTAKLYDHKTQQSVQQEFTRDADIRKSPLPYIHPPFEALLFLPLTFVSYPKAYLLWNATNLAMLIYIAVLLRRYAPYLQKIHVLELVLFLLAFFPVFANFYQGQDAILLLLLFALGFAALQKNFDFSAGCWFGLGMFKYHFVLPVALLLWWWKGKRFGSGFLTTGLLAVTVSIGIVGWQGALSYPKFMWRVLSVPGYGQTPPGLMPNFMGLLEGWSPPGHVGWMGLTIASVAGAALFVFVARHKSFSEPRVFDLAFASAVTSAILIAFNTNIHDLSLVVLPIMIVGREFARDGKVNMGLLLPIVPLLVSPFWFLLWIRWGKTNLVAVLLLWWIYAIQQEISRTRQADAEGAIIGSSA